MREGVLARYAAALSADEGLNEAMRQVAARRRSGDWSSADRALRASANAAAARAAWGMLRESWARLAASLAEAARAGRTRTGASLGGNAVLHIKRPWR